MQTGNTGFHGLVMCFCLGSSVLLARGLDMDMERTTATSQKAVRQAPSLCAGEQEYVHQRKRVVLQSLRRLAVNCTADSVPHIALLASGGGQRAAVGLVGSLYQMEKEGLLDCLLYLGGVSGSTWSMSSVYSDPEWSINIDATVARLSGPGVELEAVLAWLGERAKEENFSLTDIWGVFTSAGIMKQMDLRHLSDEASRNTTNPYPIYSAIEKHCFSSGPIEGQWFEVSPHEAGFTELGLFVETSLLGSKFKSGELLEETPEMDMVKLQGVLGCALAHEDTMKEFIPPWLNVAGQRDSAAEEYLRVYSGLHKLVALTRSTVKDPTALSYLGELQQILEDQMKRSESAWLEPKSVEERKRLSQLLRTELLTAVETWSESLEAGAFRTQGSSQDYSVGVGNNQQLSLPIPRFNGSNLPSRSRKIPPHRRGAADERRLPSIPGREEGHRPHHRTRVQRWQRVRDADSSQRLRGRGEEAVPRDRRAHAGGEGVAKGLLRARGQRQPAVHHLHAAL
ncbi:cytosolic phospholipase A2 gamma-like isoform X4 [Pseudoliparis swirei]|uniref:cytosolic phospholipase A2 gamma-like isoform X4 n=1 Tax=Pseudoliparis swirei TaxID=2059687 RepID=UPI0024BDB3AC|nr:cytosolic phospholipase A2 gamma-like isoform X4 [Pseudoliparis swirei]XP_056263542.1 cytosolic phospholipase A2 gamma-like isoform X4 [Pseudoliparis swirei]